MANNERFFVAWSGLHDKSWSVSWNLDHHHAQRMFAALQAAGFRVVTRQHVV